MKLEQNGGGWGEAWANSQVVLEDKKTGEKFDMLEADLEDDVDTFQVG